MSRMVMGLAALVLLGGGVGQARAGSSNIPPLAIEKQDSLPDVLTYVVSVFAA